jgi:hypothetical protein
MKNQGRGESTLSSRLPRQAPAKLPTPRIIVFADMNVILGDVLQVSH